MKQCWNCGIDYRDTLRCPDCEAYYYDSPDIDINKITIKGFNDTEIAMMRTLQQTGYSVVNSSEITISPQGDYIIGVDPYIVDTGVTQITVTSISTTEPPDLPF